MAPDAPSSASDLVMSNDSVMARLYAAQTSSDGPSIMIVLSESHTALSHVDSTTPVLCDVNSTVLPSLTRFFRCSEVLAENAASPVLRASSIM